MNFTNLFGALSDIEFAEKNADTIKNGMIAAYETAYYQATGEKITLYPGDPRRLFLLTIADVIILQRNLIDWTAKQNLLAFASESRLDHLGIYLGVKRLPQRQAWTTARFTLSAPQPVTTIIPAGIRMTPGSGTVYFMTNEALTIPAGELTGDVKAVAMDSGTHANGLLPGQINRLVDPLPYVQGVGNVTMSEGGADTEDDENFRERIHLAPESFSNAGSAGAYKFWARSASQLISDVGVHSPSPGLVDIYPLLRDGELPGPEITGEVMAACNSDTVRPLTDLVTVRQPEAVPFTLDVTWYLDRKNTTAAVSVTDAVNQAVRDWLLWQRAELGRDINPSELIRRMVQSGAKRAEVSSPAFTALAFSQVAVCSDDPAAAVFGGVEDG